MASVVTQSTKPAIEKPIFRTYTVSEHIIVRLTHSYQQLPTALGEPYAN